MSNLCQDIAQEVLAKLFQQVVGEQIANIGFSMSMVRDTLEPIRKLMSDYQDDFMPNLKGRLG